ncbi:MAG: DUF1501 domain-containing protein [Verrucomicrobia bacterium]|nr:DUF1501 domain-containing protein [Verrucomicrobiota bacterium]
MSNNHEVENNDISRREFLQRGTAGVVGLGVGGSGRLAASDSGARCGSVILLWMQGGVSHLDTFDPKPDAPADIRGPFKAIGTNVPGIQLCEHLPHMARIADKIAFIRSMHHTEGAHERGMSYMLSGCKPLPGISRPSLGAVISKTFGSSGSVPCCVNVSGDGVFQRGSCAAFDLNKEPERVREAYGNTGLGRKCLAARRLVEAGARFVSVEEVGWDHHFQAFGALKYRLPMLDRAVSALIGDLAGRGQFDRTMVVFATEFGRSPRINNESGREHHQGVFSCFLAGGGVRGGQAIGASDRRGESPAGRPVTPEDLFCTIYAQIGVGNRTPHVASTAGLPGAVLETGHVIHELV